MSKRKRIDSDDDEVDMKSSLDTTVSETQWAMLKEFCPQYPCPCGGCINISHCSTTDKLFKSKYYFRIVYSKPLEEVKLYYEAYQTCYEIVDSVVDSHFSHKPSKVKDPVTLFYKGMGTQGCQKWRIILKKASDTGILQLQKVLRLWYPRLI